MPKYRPTLELDDWHEDWAVTDQLEEIYQVPTLERAAQDAPELLHGPEAENGYRLSEQVSKIHHLALRRLISVDELHAAVRGIRPDTSQPVDPDEQFGNIISGLDISLGDLLDKTDRDIEYLRPDTVCVEKVIDAQILESERAGDSDETYVITTDEDEPRYLIALSGSHEGNLVTGHLAIDVEALKLAGDGSATEVQLYLEFSGEEEGYWLRTPQGNSWDTHELGLMIIEGAILAAASAEELLELSDFTQQELKELIARLDIVTHLS